MNHSLSKIRSPYVVRPAEDRTSQNKARIVYLGRFKMPGPGASRISPIRCGVAPPLTPWLSVLNRPQLGRFFARMRSRDFA